MIRKRLATHEVGAEPGFRLRGREVSRVEGFSDAVFGFALTLLIVSLEVPRTFDELLLTMRGFVAFAISFYLLVRVWFAHYVFFRRYGLHDTYTISLNGVLLFVILFYVYPLKFLFTLVVNQFTGIGTDVAVAGGGVKPMIETAQVPLLFVIYGAGFTAVFVIFALLYHHAERGREALELNAIELFDTRSEKLRYLMLAGVGVLSMCVALVVPARLAGLAGFVYFLIAVIESVHGARSGRRRRQLEAELGAPAT